MAAQGFGVREREREEEKLEGAGNCSEIRASVCASGGVSVWLWVSGAGQPVGTEGRRKEVGIDRH